MGAFSKVMDKVSKVSGTHVARRPSGSKKPKKTGAPPFNKPAGLKSIKSLSADDKPLKTPAPKLSPMLAAPPKDDPEEMAEGPMLDNPTEEAAEPDGAMIHASHPSGHQITVMLRGGMGKRFRNIGM